MATTTQYDSFIRKLKEIFMMDQADLNFGIYRIMNQKRRDIQQFLEKDLLPQVKQILRENNPGAEALQQELSKTVQALREMGVNPDEATKVQQLKAQIAASGDLSALENEVYSHLTTFFSRYYDEGDFISKRRYKDNTYAIPYNGEEVKLHWANADQYYIKTSENFKDYSFRLSDGRLVHFTLKDATTEQNNNKTQNNQERRFALFHDTEGGTPTVETIDGELHIYFTYELTAKTNKQKDLNAQALDTLRTLIPEEWAELLAPVSDADKRALVEKHLADYTAKNTFDYFIHKDLGGFLRRELDFYIKNEVLHIDDLDTQHIQSQLSQVKAIKGVGEKIIRMLAQLEDFQKKLWLKKKFVVQADYCITLDRVPHSLYSEICQNDAQREEWVRLFAIDDIKGDLTTEGYSVPLTERFLEENPFLVLDTAFFSAEFKHRLVSDMENIDEKCNGLLINSENFQALELLQEKYKSRIGTIITDPPYNTGSDDFLYKDNYSDSSWLSMMDDRLKLSSALLQDNSWVSININDIELYNLKKLVDSNNWYNINQICVKMSHLSGMKMSHIDKKIPKIKEQILTFSRGDKSEIDPIYEPCSWDDCFSRYSSWMEFNNSEDCSKWTTTTVRTKAKEKGIDLKNQEALDEFRIKNASHIFRTAVDDAVANTPKDGKIRFIKTAQGLEKYILNGEDVLFASSYMKEIDGCLSPVQLKGDIWTDIAINNVHNEGGVQLPNGKKPVKLYERLIKMFSKKGDIILDIFAGSATITHACMNLNENNKYIAIQCGNSYFKEKTLRRTENVIYSKEWKLDKPVSRDGISQCFKYIRLEQYEDTLNNLVVKQPGGLFGDDEDGSWKETYMLGYMMDTETSGSLFNMEWFKRPFNMTLKTTKNNELVETPVDMVETFNFLIGLEVDTQHWHQQGHICAVEGRLHRTGEAALVIWRDCEYVSNEALNEFFRKMDYSTQGREFDVIYVNGDNTLPNMRRDEDHWKVVLTEEEFQRRMFEES